VLRYVVGQSEPRIDDAGVQVTRALSRMNAALALIRMTADSRNVILALCAKAPGRVSRKDGGR